MTSRPAVVVLTLNEEKNLAACLESVAGWAPELFVVDSGSTDTTLEIARRFGAAVREHAFETHARQWTWALENLPLEAAWVLGLDADQILTPELKADVEQLLAAEGGTGNALAGAYVRRRQVFHGRWIRHGGYYPKYLLKLFRRDKVRLDPNDLVDHHFVVDGPTMRLESDLIESNRNEDDIDVWIRKHLRYARLQAEEEYRRGRKGPRGGRFLGTPDQRIRWLKGIWARLPLFVRPPLYFIYRYGLRLGFLDGREGFLFHFLQGFWYRVLVDQRLLELRRAGMSAGLIAQGEQ